jgi:hypothetical protein
MELKHRHVRELELGYLARYGADPAAQRRADEERAKPPRVVPKAVVQPPRAAPLRPSPGTIPDQRVLGVRVLPPRGDGDGPVARVRACPNDRANVDTEQAWVGGLRGSSQQPQTTLRRSAHATCSGTVMGAESDPDQLRRGRGVTNSFNRLEPHPGALLSHSATHTGGGSPQSKTTPGLLEWYQG